MLNLAKEETIKLVLKEIENHNARIKINSKLMDIYEGSISEILDEKMLSDLGKKSFSDAEDRKAPINILTKIIDKLSKIYQHRPRRDVINGNDQDQKILKWFEEVIDIDVKMNSNNELLNLFHYSLLQISNDKGKPFVRSIPNDKFIIINTNQVDPTSPDIIVLFMDPIIDTNGESIGIYFVYHEDSFAIYDTKGGYRQDVMVDFEQDGTIPYGEKPFVYANKSVNLPMPKTRDDDLDMTLLPPLMFTDLNYAAKYMSFSLMYGIDVDTKLLERAPNAILDLKSDTDSDKKPEIGTLKPEVDIDKVSQLITTEIAIWLNTKGIKPGSIGTATVESAASGISKMIDEGDITESRNIQVNIYKKLEKEFWDLLLHKIYPFWVEQGLVDNMGSFSPNAHVVTAFIPQTPLQDRNTITTALKAEVDAGFISVRRAIKKLNPEMSDKEIDDLIAEIDNEKPRIEFTSRVETD
jgi:hypothetical protein